MCFQGQLKPLLAVRSLTHLVSSSRTLLRKKEEMVDWQLLGFCSLTPTDTTTRFATSVFHYLTQVA